MAARSSIWLAAVPLLLALMFLVAGLVVSPKEREGTLMMVQGRGARLSPEQNADFLQKLRDEGYNVPPSMIEEAQQRASAMLRRQSVARMLYAMAGVSFVAGVLVFFFTGGPCLIKNRLMKVKGPRADGGAEVSRRPVARADPLSAQEPTSIMESTKIPANFQDVACPSCGKPVRVWPFVYGGLCPHCRGELSLKKALDDKQIELQCPACRGAIRSWITVINRKCHLCNAPLDVLEKRAEAARLTDPLRPHRVWSVMCEVCSRLAEAKNLRTGLFPNAGYCCGCDKIVCWSCARLQPLTPAQEHEIAVMQQRLVNILGRSAMVDTPSGPCFPHCPTCGKWLETLIVPGSASIQGPGRKVECHEIVPAIPESLLGLSDSERYELGK